MRLSTIRAMRVEPTTGVRAGFPRVVLLVSAIGLAACGGGTATDTTVRPVAATTTVPASTVAPTTTRPPATTTTVAAGMSRDATLAVARCADLLGFLFAEQVSLDDSYLTMAQDACDEATLQAPAER